MKKKLVSILLISALAIATVGCGQKNETTDGTGNAAEETTDGQESAAADSDAAEDGSSENSENAEADSETIDASQSSLLNIDITNVSLSASDEERDRYRIVDIEYNKFSLADMDAKQHPELAKTLEDWNQNEDTEMTKELSRLKSSYIASEYEEYVDAENYPTYENKLMGRILRADQTVFSVLHNFYIYEGGAHGYYTLNGDTYDVASGKQLNLSDVITDKDAFISAVIEKLKTKYTETDFFEDLNDFFKEKPIDGDGGINWSMDYSGVTVYFQPYELASYADGILSVRFSFAQEGNLFDAKYANVPDSYVAPLTDWIGTFADIDNDGKEDEINVFCNYPDEEYGYYSWDWNVDGQTIASSTEGFSNDSYLVKKNDKYYAYMFTTEENDYQVLSVVDLATHKNINEEYGWGLSLHGTDYGYDDNSYWYKQNALINPDSFTLDTRMDLLSTYSGYKEYHVGDDGAPVSEDEFFAIDNFGFLIAPVRDLPCQIIDKDGNVLEENATLPADTMLRIIRNNGEDVVDLQAGDYEVTQPEWSDDEYPYWNTEEPVDMERGTFYRITLEVRDYEKTIGGEPVYDLFKGMMYAG